MLGKIFSSGSIRKAGIAFAALFLIVGMVGPAAGVSAANLSYATDGGDGAPNPYVSTDVTVDAYQTSWGDSLQYEDDSGAVSDLPAELNSSTDHDDLGSGAVNPFTFTATDIEFSDAGEFPRKNEESGDNVASALDASEWTTSGGSVSDVTTAPSVDALSFVASTSGDSATYSNFSVTSDAEKRYVQAFYDVNSASGDVDLVVQDATDGDTATVKLYDGDGNTSNDNVGATTTGEGKVVQVQLGKLTASGGDGTIQEIGSVQISAGGAADVDLSAINVEKTSKYKLGERYHDNDNDDELETETVYETDGPLSVSSVDTLGTVFDDATIHGLTFPAHFEAAELSGDNVNVTSQSGDAAGYPGWDTQSDIYYRLTLPSAYDLSYSSAELVVEQQYTETHYKSVEYAESTGDTAFADIEDSQWTAITDSFSSEGSTVTVDSTVQPGTSMVMHFSNTWTAEEWGAITSGSAGGGAGIFGGGGGSIVDMIFGIPGMIAAVVGGLIGRAKGWI